MRSTPDLVVLALAIGASGSLMIVAAGIVIATLVQPERDLSGAIDGITRLLTALVGVIIGYLAGWRRDTREQRERRER